MTAHQRHVTGLHLLATLNITYSRHRRHLLIRWKTVFADAPSGVHREQSHKIPTPLKATDLENGAGPLYVA